MDLLRSYRGGAKRPPYIYMIRYMDPWIHGSISFIMNHIFCYEMKNSSKIVDKL